MAATGWLYVLLAAFAALFQIALALGAPWGKYALGGRWQGKLPLPVRIFALVQMLVALRDLVREGGVTLRQAIDTFDYRRRDRFTSYLRWALMRAFARTLPEEHY